MFKEYPNYLSEFQLGRRERVHKAAYEHSKLVAYLNHLSTFLLLNQEEIQDAYKQSHTAINKAIKSDNKAATSAIRANLYKGVKQRYCQYDFTPGYRARFNFTTRNDINQMELENSNLLSHIILRITALEIVITMEEAVNPDQELRDTIISAVNKYHMDDMNLGSFEFNPTEGLKDEVSWYIAENDSKYYRDLRLHINVNLDWVNTIHNKDLAQVKLGNGAEAFIMKAEKEETTDEYDLYKIKMIYVKGTREDREKLEYWNFRQLTKEQKQKAYEDLVKYEDAYMAVSNIEGDETKAVGKDKRWALATFNRRSKAAMIKALGI